MNAPVAASRPDADRPSPSLLARLRATLVAELDAQRRAVADLEATAESLMGQTDSDSLLERELAERAALRAREAEIDIQHALARIDRGTYGACDRCGGPIAAARLEAIPHTRFCVGCPPAAPRLIG